LVTFGRCLQSAHDLFHVSGGRAAVDGRPVLLEVEAALLERDDELIRDQLGLGLAEVLSVEGAAEQQASK
jgi:hypothetical protein